MTKTNFHPEIIIYNGRLFDRPRKESAVAISGGRVLALDNDDRIKALAGPETRQIDARHRWLLPAFTDGHAHLTATAAQRLQVDLRSCRSRGEALNKVREKVKRTPEGRWIWGGGWDVNRWETRAYPTRSDLDAVSTRHLIALRSKDGHGLWVNSAVLQKFAVTSGTPDPPGGRILRDDSGEPNGILLETAREAILQSKTLPPEEELIPALLETFRDFHRQGITAAHCMETPEEFHRYRKFLEENILKLRIFLYLPVRFQAQIKELQNICSRNAARLQICGVKLFADGTLSSLTADMLENYEGADHSGVATLSQAELTGQIMEASAAGVACAVHAIGDAANRKVLDAFEKAWPESRKHGLQHRIEHAQLLHPADIPRFQRLNITASMQPRQLATDIPQIGRFWGRRGRYAYSFNSLMQAGARLMFGSDTPIEPYSPFEALYSAVSRRANCQPESPAFFPEEQISISDALRAYTFNGAQTVGMASQMGSISPGCLADIILIDTDIFNEPPEALLQTRVLLTLQAGEIVFRAE